MENGVDRGRTDGSGPSRAWSHDGLGAVMLAEGRISECIYASGFDVRAPRSPNAFGAHVVTEHGDPETLSARLESAAADGRRAALIVPAYALGAARTTLRAIARRRLPAVVHAVAERTVDTPQAGSPGLAEALALADLGWGLLFASSVEEALDMSLIARRAAEDCGTPFAIVHERGGVAGARHLEPVAPPSVELCEVFVGEPTARIRKIGDPSHPIHAEISERAFAERVPFALASAMRELDALTGRRHDVIERIPAMDAQVVMVGMGELGESLLGAVERLRAHGHDVGAVKLTAFRPFPGARLVKILSRALVVSIVETVDQPLSQSNPLARELKAAFADAITWAPHYPGVGRIPRIVSGVAHTGAHELSAEDVDAIVHNMLSSDERAKRTFVFGADETHALDRPEIPKASPSPSGIFTMRGRVKDARTAEACAELCAAVLHSALGLRARGSVRVLRGAEGDGVAFDIVASRERPRGMHAPHRVRAVALGDLSALVRNNPLSRLEPGGLVAVPTQQRSADGVWAELPPYAKAIVFDRNARVVGFTSPSLEGVDADAAPWLFAATFAGLALASVSPGGAAATRRAPIDASLVAREVAEALTVAMGPSHEALARRGGDIARGVYEASVEVPRATIERDEEAVRLGRRDARATPR